MKAISEICNNDKTFSQKPENYISSYAVFLLKGNFSQNDWRICEDIKQYNSKKIQRK